MKDLINFPEEGYEDSGEGGLAVFLVLLSEMKRQKCIAGQGAWPCQDVVIAPSKYVDLNHSLCRRESGGYAPADLVMLIDSTNRSLWSERLGEYWRASKEDLTEEGKQLFKMLTDVYGEEPDIVTLLDT